jgi:hypothetical protein
MANTSREDLMPGSSGQEGVLFAGHPSIVPNLGTLLLTIVTLGLFAIYAWAKSSGTSYRITTQRIVVEHRVFSKRMEQIDLYRVVDYVVDRPFGQRILGTGNIVLEAMDKTTPSSESRAFARTCWHSTSGFVTRPRPRNEGAAYAWWTSRANSEVERSSSPTSFGCSDGEGFPHIEGTFIHLD